jgi:hypothetical protein
MAVASNSKYETCHGIELREKENPSPDSERVEAWAIIQHAGIRRIGIKK